MNKYKSLITGSLVAVMLITTPAISFAERNNKNDDDENKVRVEQKSEVKTKRGFLGLNFRGKSESSNAIFHRFTDWFSNKKAINENRKEYRKTEDSTEIIRKDNMAPLISEITAPTVLKVDEVGTWEVKASDPKNGALSYAVDWGDTNLTSKPLSLLSNQVFVQTGTFTHSYADKGIYKVKFTIANEAGLKIVSTVTVHVVDKVGEVDTKAPVISDIGIKTGLSSNATISWKTDEKTKSEVFYGTNSGLDTNSSSTLKVSDGTLKTNHSLSIPSLASKTLYHFIVKSVDASNNVSLSSEATFVTN